MDSTKWLELEEDFREWTGGFPPDSPHEITVYIDYASKFPGRDEEVRRYLNAWQMRGDDDFDERHEKASFNRQ
jgi:hypothetical protein